MEKVMPPAILQEGDLIRVVETSMPISRAMPDGEKRKAAEDFLRTHMGVDVECPSEMSASDRRSIPARQRMKDLIEAFTDKDVKGVMAAWGGFDTNELLLCEEAEPGTGKLWQVIRQNPKPFMGASDNGVLNNAITAQTGLQTLYGINFGTFYGVAGKDGPTLEHGVLMADHLKRLLMSRDPVTIPSSSTWADFVQPTKLLPTDGPRVWRVRPGIEQTTGRLAVGCLRNYSSMVGSQYQLPLDAYDDTDEGTIICIDDTDVLSKEGAQRDWANIMLNGAQRSRVKGIMLGRIAMHQYSAYHPKDEKEDIASNSPFGSFRMGMIFHYLNNIRPDGGLFKNLEFIVTDFDFGHTYPTVSLPLGGYAVANFSKSDFSLTVSSYPQ